MGIPHFNESKYYTKPLSLVGTPHLITQKLDMRLEDFVPDKKKSVSIIGSFQGAVCSRSKKGEEKEKDSRPRVLHDTVRLVIPPLGRYVARANVRVGETLGVSRPDQEMSSEEDSASETCSVSSNDSGVDFLVSLC